MNQPLVTVFIPLYNCETYIEEAIESIVNQTYSNLEILIVDDGSTDSSIELVNSFNDPRVRIVRNDENKGIPYTRNVGLHEAKGKYMAIMDADDIALPNRIEKQLEFMESHPDIDALGSYYEIFGGKTTKSFNPKYIKSEELKAGLLFFNRIGNPTSMIRLETLKKHNITYNLDCFVAQDYEMWVQISKVGNLYILPEILLRYRFGHANVTKNSQQTKIERRKKIIYSIHKDILDFNKFKLTEEELNIFNEFFDDNFSSSISEQSVQRIPAVLSKLLIQNQENGNFTEEVLQIMIRDAVLTSINFRKIKFSDKINLYNQVCKSKHFSEIMRELSFMTAKHFYLTLRS